MENRFGFRDLVQAVLLVAILVSIWIAMKQYDRQLGEVLRVKEQLRQQTEVQAQMQRALGEVLARLEEGVSVAQSGNGGGSTGPTTVPGGVQSNPFYRIERAAQKPDYTRGDWLIDAFGANVAKITPLVSVDVYGATIQARVLDTLGTRDPETLEWMPLLASGWKIDDHSEPWQAYVDKRQAEPLSEEEIRREPGFLALEQPDAREEYGARRLKEGRRVEDIVEEPDSPVATTITFRLRRGVSFSDGQPLTARDVVFTYRLIMNEKLDAPREREAMRDVIKDVQAPGEFEVVFTFKKPYFESFGMAASMYVMPEHFYTKFTPEEINQTPGLLLGSGPYRMESPTDWTPGKLLVLVRNERYWGVPPAFDRLIFREINLDASRLQEFQNRAIDVFGAQPEQYVQMIKDPDLLERTSHFEFERVVGGYGFIAWNQRRRGQPTIFADGRVRRAMTMMIDRQRLFDEILLGYGIPVSGPFNRLSPQSDPSIEPWSYDVEAAKALLREAGYFDRNNDGIIDGPDGEPFRFHVLFPSQTGFWDRVLLMLKDNLARAGVVMELEPLEWSVFDERVKARNYDALCMAWSGGIESDIRQMFHSSQIANQADNFTSYNNPELDRLIDEARRTVEEEKRMPLWQACHRILHEDQPYTFLYSRKSLLFLDGRIHNVEEVKLGLNDRDEWYVPKPLQYRGK